MRKHALFVAMLLGCSAVVAAPSILANVVRLHNIADASFPAAGATNTGGLIYGTTTTSTYWSDGTAWHPFGVVFHGTNTPQAIERGSGAPAAGTLVVTFGTAFTSVPTCTCADGSGGVTVGCNHGTCTANGCTFVTVGTSTTMDWICIGNK